MDEPEKLEDLDDPQIEDGAMINPHLKDGGNYFPVAYKQVPLTGNYWCTRDDMRRWQESRRGQ